MSGRALSRRGLMTSLVVVVVVLCFLIGSLWNRNNFGSRQDVLRLFNRFFSDSHRHAADYSSHHELRDRLLRS